MKLTLRMLLASLVLIFSLLACGEMPEDDYEEYDYESPPAEELTEEEYEEEVGEEPGAVSAMSCPAITNEIIDLAVYGSEGEEDLLDEELVLITYTIEGDEIFDPVYEEGIPADLQADQEDEDTHLQLWEYFAALIPAEQRGNFAEYAISTDGTGGTLASVIQTTSDPNFWVLHVDIADTANYYELTYTLVHEFAHVLTLGPDQVTPSMAVFNNPEDNNIYLQELSACPNYFPGEGCADANSYIDDFYYEFWDELREEWDPINLEEDEDARTELLDEFYSQYEDRFVTSYAATNPEEDIAESFTFFIFSPKPAGDTILEEKILFFYNYPELVELRETILNNTCVSFPN